MPRVLRRYLVGCIAIAFAYLIWHATEPLRLNIGDPWADAELVSSLTHPGASASSHVVAESPLSAIVYGAIAKLGVTDIGVFRLFALAFSALGAWALFRYLRRMWSDSVALLGTTLFTTSLLSVMHADSLQSPPLAHAACFIALWGLVRATETNQLRHHAAATIGAFACMFAASDQWLFLSAGALCTISGKRGSPLARGNLRFVIVCAAGGIAGVLARSQFVVDAAEWPRSLDNSFVVPVVLLATLALSPAIWIAVASAIWQALRSASLRAALDDAMTWLVAVAVIFVCVASPRPGAPMLRVVSVLPFFAIGSALLIDRMRQRDLLRRTLGTAWILIATGWGFGGMLCHTRTVLGRDDVASLRTYLASNDGNDFVISNLSSDGVLQAAFDRRGWSAIAEHDHATPDLLRGRLLEVFEAAGTDHVHAVIFTPPAARFVDRSLGQLARYRGLHPATAWPSLIDATGAKQVLHFDSFDVYRIDRRSVLDQAAQSIPVARKLDFSSPTSSRYELLGWQGPQLSDLHQVGVTSIAGYAACPDPLLEARAGAPVRSACETAASETGLRVPDARPVGRALLMIRVDRACDLRMTVEVEPETTPVWFLTDSTAPVLGVSLGGYTASQCASSRRMSFVIPQRFVQAGINVVTFTTQSVGLLEPPAALRSLELDPILRAGALTPVISFSCSRRPGTACVPRW